MRAAPRDTQVAISRLHTAASSAARAAAHGFLKSYSLVGTRGDADLKIRSSSLDAIQ